MKYGKIYNLEGKIIYGTLSKQNEVMIDINDQPNGLYILKLHIDNQIYTAEFIKE